MRFYDYGRLQGALEVMQAVPAESRLLALKNLCMNNGVWNVPDAPSDYAPCLFEVSAFEISAHAAEPAELPRNWMEAASNVLRNASAAA